MIKIVVDSTCDLPQSFIEDHGITVLPLHVIVDGNDYLDGVDISTAEVFSLMRRGVMPTTAQVNLVDAYCSIGALADAGDDVLCLMFSSKMSSTYQSISLVISDLREKYDGQKFVALDSEGGSFATGLITMEAVKTVESGSTFEEVVDRCKFLIDHVEHVFTIDDLKWMVRGGRISKTAGFTADLLNIKPILDVDDGVMEVIHKIRGRKRAMEKVADIVASRVKECQSQVIGITHADDIPAAETMRELLRVRLPKADFLIEKIGALLGVHLGIGGVGVFFFNQM